MDEKTIVGTIANLIRRVDELEKQVAVLSSIRRKYITMIELPKHLQETYQVVADSGEQMSAAEVCAVTRKSRAVESGYLNQLARTHKVTKSKRGRQTVFARGDNSV